MQITFDTTTLTDDEVRGIFALLDTVRPEALVTGEPMVGITLEQREALAAVYGEDAHVQIDSEGAVTVVDAHHPEAPPTTDSTGLPWDERIHASSKALNADGTWRTKRGVDKALVAEVEAELRSQSETVESAEVRYFYHPESESFFTGTDDSPLGNGETVELSKADWEERQKVTIAPPAPETPTPSAPPAPTAPLAPAVTQSAPSSAVSPFVALMKRVTTAQGAGKLTQPRVKELLESLDKKSIMDLRTDEDALASFAVLLDGEGV